MILARFKTEGLSAIVRGLLMGPDPTQKIRSCSDIPWIRFLVRNPMDLYPSRKSHGFVFCRKSHGFVS